MNLVPAIREMESEIRQRENTFQKEIQELKNGLATLRKLNTVCEKCSGEGKFMRPRSCAEDDREREYINCSECGGTGKKQ